MMSDIRLKSHKMKKKNLKLAELKVKSFTTSLDKIAGGSFIPREDPITNAEECQETAELQCGVLATQTCANTRKCQASVGIGFGFCE